MRGNQLKPSYQPPIAPEKAIRYLIHSGYTDPRKLLCVARTTSGFICSRLSGMYVEMFLQTVYDERYHEAYDYVKKAYNAMYVAIPKHIHALYSCFPLWKIFMHLVYDSVTDFEQNLHMTQIIPVLREVIERAFPPELWKEFRDEPIYKP